LIALATIALAIGIYLLLSPRQDGVRGRILGFARGLTGLGGPQDRTQKPIEDIVREIDQGGESEKAEAIDLLRFGFTATELAQVFPHLIRALKDESEMVRNAAATVVGDLGQHFSREAVIAEKALTGLLDDRSPALRATAAKSLGSIAASGQLEAPPPRLVACLDDEAEHVRISAAEALVKYRKGPELIVPVALRRLPTGSPTARRAFTDLFWHVRLEPSVLPLLIGGLLGENAEVRLCCTAAINHMGPEARPALPAILSLLHKELETPYPSDLLDDHDRIIGMAAGAIGEITPDGECPPGCVEALCECLQRPGEARRGSAAARPDSPSSSRRDMTPQEECLAEAVWSLGILGRPAASAVPLLLSTFASAREASNLRGLTAESLAEISRGTPEEDRVTATLAKAWKTSPQGQKTAITRALRRLGRKSEQLVEGLGQWPADQSVTQIRRVRYPR
jgi:HEAT repeat protein